jgi:hypothetical protein
MKTDEPLTATDSKAPFETFRRNPRGITVYDAKNVSESQRKTQLQSDHAWIVVGKRKWN